MSVPPSDYKGDPEPVTTPGTRTALRIRKRPERGGEKRRGERREKRRAEKGLKWRSLGFLLHGEGRNGQGLALLQGSFARRGPLRRRRRLPLRLLRLVVGVVLVEGAEGDGWVLPSLPGLRVVRHLGFLALLRHLGGRRAWRRGLAAGREEFGARD